MQKTIAVLPGDGIGPEIMGEAEKVINAVGKKYNHRFDLIPSPFGAQAYFDHGHPFPDETKKMVCMTDAVLKGPIGLATDEMGRIPEEFRPEKAALLPLRKILDVYLGLRPIYLPKSCAHFSPLKPERLGEGLDILMAREQTEGIYFGKKVEGSETGMEYAIDVCKYTRKGVERFGHACFNEAIKKGGNFTHVHKSNVEATSRFRDAIFREIAPQYPDVKMETMMIDNFHYQLFIDPSQFNGVVAVGNKDGDTGSDGGAGAIGSLGLMPTASLNPETGKNIYEPAHGSAPAIAGKNIANPYSIIGCVAFMLDKTFGLEEESKAVWKGLESVFGQGFMTSELARPDTPRERILSTSQFGDMVVSNIAA